MRRVIESLTPGERPISWKWIGSMLAFYVVVMVAAAGLFASHQTRANLAHEAGATVAAERMQPASTHTRSLAPRLAGLNSD